MRLFHERIPIGLRWVILLVFVLLILVCALIFLSTRPVKQSNEEHIFLIMAGLIPGLAVALGQYCLQWFEFKDRDRLRDLQIINVLPARDDAAYYAKLILNAKEKIDFMGNTCSRFLQDFADVQATNSAKRILVDALNRGVAVRILVADGQFLSDEDRQAKLPMAEGYLKKLKEHLPHAKLEVKHFSHLPTTAIVQVDRNCVVGPIFPHKRSQDDLTPFLVRTGIRVCG